MAVPARIEIVDHEAVLRSGELGDSPFGSLIGRGPRTFKKKPVLVLDADELQQAHQAIAMGGAQIMEEAGDPAQAPRPRMPSVMLGLAPIGADDDWEPPAPARPPVDDEVDDWAEDEVDDWTADDETHELQAGRIGDGEDASLDDGEEEADDAAAAMSLAHLMSPAATPAVSADDWEASLPSIEEQLERMRRLSEERAAAAPPPPAEPMQEPAVFQPISEEPLDLHPTDEWEAEPQEADAPGAQFSDDATFDLPLETALPPAGEDIEDETGEPLDHGPDLSWMMPQERRPLEISGGTSSSLRARLVQDRRAAEPSAGAAPSLLDRLREWLRGMLG